MRVSFRKSLTSVLNMQLLAQQCSLPIGAWKKILEGGTLWKKYKNELNEVRNFALKFPGVGNLSRLPTSGTAQLQQMKLHYRTR
jgi:hypothetical protein